MMVSRWTVTAMMLGMAAWGVFPARAQAPATPPKVVTVKNLFGLDRNARLNTPIYTYRGGSTIVRGTPSTREWLQAVAEYQTLPDPQDRWINQLSFQFFVLTAQPGPRAGAPPQYTLFRGTVNYMDVDRNRRESRWATMYLRPSALLRYGTPVAVAVEVSADGKPMDSSSQVDRRYQDTVGRVREWWKQPPSQAILVKDGYLLKASDTPFAFVGVDDYEELAP